MSDSEKTADLESKVRYMQRRIQELVEENTVLRNRNEEFRAVYEAENRSMAVKVECVVEFGPDMESV